MVGLNLELQFSSKSIFDTRQIFRSMRNCCTDQKICPVLKTGNLIFHFSKDPPINFMNILACSSDDIKEIVVQ